MFHMLCCMFPIFWLWDFTWTVPVDANWIVSEEALIVDWPADGWTVVQNCWTWHINRSFSSSQHYHFQNEAKSKTVFQISDGSQVNDPTKMASWPDRWHISVKLNMMKKISTWSWWTLRWSTWPPPKRINWNAAKPFLWKYVLFTWESKIIFLPIASHLASF